MTAQKLDILAFAAHPDDAELACSGTLIKHIKQGYKVGIVDLTQGDQGTRGSIDIRTEEAADSARIMGLTARENLKMKDGFFSESDENLKRIIYAIRKYQPEIIFANAVSDRHPDHGRGSQIVSRANFLSGLIRIETEDNGVAQKPWRPKNIYHYIQYRYIQPDFVVDISTEWETKLKAIKAFKSQFYDPNSDEPRTLIASQQFMDHIEARAMEFGSSIEVSHGEGFTTERPIAVNRLFDLQ